MKLIFRKRPRFGSSTHYGRGPGGIVAKYRQHWIGWIGLERRRIVPNSVYAGEGDAQIITGPLDMLIVNGGNVTLGEGADCRNVTIIRGGFTALGTPFEFGSATVERLHVHRGFAGTIPPPTPTPPAPADSTRTPGA